MQKLFPALALAMAFTAPLSCCPDEPETGPAGWGEACVGPDDCDHSFDCFRGYCTEKCDSVAPGDVDPTEAGDCSPIYLGPGESVPQTCLGPCVFRCDNGRSCPVIPDFGVTLVCGYDGMFCAAE